MTGQAAYRKPQSESPHTPESTRDRQVFIPPTDIYETQDAITIVADVPGVTSDSLDIELDKHVLTIRAQAREHTPKGYTPAYREYEAGDYERSFRLSEDINEDGIQAKLNHGVLTLTLPKAVPSQKKIRVTAG